MSMGSAGAPKPLWAIRPCSAVSGRTAWVSNQPRRRTPKRARLHATPRAANSSPGLSGYPAAAVGTGYLLDRDLLRTEQSSELLDGGKALEPRGAREDVDVD